MSQGEITIEEREAGAVILPFNFGHHPTRNKKLSEIFEMDGGQTLLEISRWKKTAQIWPNEKRALDRYLAVPRIGAIVALLQDGKRKKRCSVGRGGNHVDRERQREYGLLEHRRNHGQA